MDKTADYITKEKKLALEKELEELKGPKRKEIINRLEYAKSLGDLSENAEYHAAREKQGFIEGRIIDLEDKSARAEVIDISKLSGQVVKFGAKVQLIDEETNENFVYSIVGDYEADISKGLISLSSPIDRGLIGKSQGDSAEITTPKGIKYYEIVKVEYV